MRSICFVYYIHIKHIRVCAQNLEGHEPGPLDAVEAGAGPARVTARRAPPPLVTSDPAVLALWSEVEVAAHAGLADLLREHTFVGMVRKQESLPILLQLKEWWVIA